MTEFQRLIDEHQKTPDEARHAAELERLRGIVRENKSVGRPDYHGLSSSEIGTLNRASMCGDDGAGFPDADEWSAWTD